jgi:hypothetical protein
MIPIADLALVGLLLLGALPVGILMFAAWGAVVFAEPLGSEVTLPEHGEISELEQRLGEEIEPVSDGGDR